MDVNKAGLNLYGNLLGKCSMEGKTHYKCLSNLKDTERVGEEH